MGLCHCKDLKHQTHQNRLDQDNDDWPTAESPDQAVERDGREGRIRVRHQTDE